MFGGLHVLGVRVKGLIMHYATVLISVYLQTNKQQTVSKCLVTGM